MGFAHCPLLTGGAVELLQAHGSDEQKQRYLAKLVSGEWMRAATGRCASSPITLRR